MRNALVPSVGLFRPKIAYALPSGPTRLKHGINRHLGRPIYPPGGTAARLGWQVPRYARGPAVESGAAASQSPFCCSLGLKGSPETSGGLARPYEAGRRPPSAPWPPQTPHSPSRRPYVHTRPQAATRSCTAGLTDPENRKSRRFWRLWCTELARSRGAARALPHNRARGEPVQYPSRGDEQHQLSPWTCAAMPGPVFCDFRRSKLKRISRRREPSHCTPLTVAGPQAYC